MKSTYTKPVLVMESFVMSQSIAHNCGDQLNFGQATLKYKSSCGWDTGIDIVFTQSNVCTGEVITENQLTGVCYNNPEGGFNVFNS